MTSKRLTVLMAGIAIAGLLASGGYALSALIGVDARIVNASIVSGGAQLKGPTITARASRVGPPIYRDSIAGGTTPTAATNWQHYE